MKQPLLALVAFCAATVIYAEPTDTLGIIGRIDSNPSLEVIQPEKLAQRLLPARHMTEITPDDSSSTPAAQTGGYRVQVFSSNNPRTARAEAHGRAATIGAEFPEWATYVSFDAPYWRLKVGDFRSYEDGRAALSLLKKQFPAYAKEMRLVRDRIKTSD
ncbi:MAG: SPOR domain-containing protein [Muribaculaceae bacterium]|nr:SPOR domain-containing protein [Muribaculaceae bacterium]